jgi:hypothetical protein
MKSSGGRREADMKRDKQEMEVGNSSLEKKKAPTGIEQKEDCGFSKRGTVLRQPDSDQLFTQPDHCAIDKSARLWSVADWSPQLGF